MKNDARPAKASPRIPNSNGEATAPSGFGTRLRPHAGFAIIDLGSNLIRTMNRIVRAHNLSLKQFHALAEIGDEPEVTQIQLAEKLAVDGSRAVILIDGLEKAGLASRRLSQTDRRVRELHLTDEGRRVAEALVCATLEFEGTLATHLSKAELRELLRLTAKLQSAILQKTERTESEERATATAGDGRRQAPARLDKQVLNLPEPRARGNR